MSRRNLLAGSVHINYLVRQQRGEHVTLNYDEVIRRLKNGYRGRETSSSFWDSPVFASEFCPTLHNKSILAYANEEGSVFIWDMKGNGRRPRDGVDAHNNAIFDLTWSAREFKLVTVSGDKTAVLWDAGASRVRRIQTFGGHSATVKSVAWEPDSDHLFCSGDRNSAIFVWDCRTAKPENVIYNAHERSGVGNPSKKNRMVDGTSITGLAFYQPQYLISCAAVSECIRLWDLRKYYAAYSGKPRPVQEFKNPKFDDNSGYSYLTIDRSQHRVYVTSVHDRIYSFALNSPDVSTVTLYVGAYIRSFYIKSCLSIDGQYLVSGSSTEFCLIWNTGKSDGGIVRPLRKLDTAGFEVNSVSWCRTRGDQHKIVVFPECSVLEVYDINCVSIPESLWREYEPIPEVREMSEVEVSDVVKDGMNDTLELRAMSPNSTERNNHRKGRLRVHPTHSDIRKSLSQIQTKRTALENLDNHLEERQSKKMKLGHTLSPRRLFVCPSTNDTDEIDSTKLASHSTINGLDMVKNLSCSTNSQFMTNDQEDDGDVKENKNKVVVSPEKNSFSPTSNLPNHVIDGTSPSHVCRPYRKKCVDWLTQLRHEKVADEEITNRRVTESHLRKSEISKKVQKRKHESILKFFCVSGKSNDELLKSQDTQTVSIDQS